MTSLSEQIDNFAPYLDIYTTGFVIAVFALSIGGIFWLSGSAAIALVTAVTASVAIYRLRRPDKTQRPAVLPSFTADSSCKDFGLQNYGPGAALYLQVAATLSNAEDPLFTIGPREYPLHLPEGEFLGFVHDDRVPNDGLLSAVDDVKDDEAEPDEMVYFYYSYISPAGVREPEKMLNETDRDDEEILGSLMEESNKPRRMEVMKIQQHCSQENPKGTVIDTNQ